MRRKVNNFLFLLGLVSVVVMFFTFDISFAELADYVRAAGLWLPLAIVLWFGLYMMNAWAWQAIIQSDGEAKVGFWYVMKLTISGFALNYVTPVGVLGGEPYRIMELSRRVGTERATSSVLLFSMMHVFSHFWYWLTAIAVFLALIGAGVFQGSPYLYVLLAVAAVFCLVAVYFFVAGYRKGMVVKFFRILGHIPGLRGWAQRFTERNAEKLATIDQQIAALHAQNKRAFALSFGLEYVGRLLQSLEIFFILLLMGNPCTWMLLVKSYLILAFTSLFANLIGFIPMQIGGREGGFAMSVSQLGMTSAMGLFVGIFCRLREMVWIVIGLALMKVGRNAD